MGYHKDVPLRDNRKINGDPSGRLDLLSSKIENVTSQTG
jgi:hypothetical protein